MYVNTMPVSNSPNAYLRKKKQEENRSKNVNDLNKEKSDSIVIIYPVLVFPYKHNICTAIV